MRRLLLGGLLAFLPLTLLAQPLDQRASRSGSFQQTPGNSRVVVMPPPSGVGTPNPGRWHGDTNARSGRPDAAAGMTL